MIVHQSHKDEIITPVEPFFAEQRYLRGVTRRYRFVKVLFALSVGGLITVIALAIVSEMWSLTVWVMGRRQSGALGAAVGGVLGLFVLDMRFLPEMRHRQAVTITKRRKRFFIGTMAFNVPPLWRPYVPTDVPVRILTSQSRGTTGFDPHIVGIPEQGLIMSDHLRLGLLRYRRVWPLWSFAGLMVTISLAVSTIENLLGATLALPIFGLAPARLAFAIAIVVGGIAGVLTLRNRRIRARIAHAMLRFTGA